MTDQEFVMNSFQKRIYNAIKDSVNAHVYVKVENDILKIDISEGDVKYHREFPEIWDAILIGAFTQIVTEVLFEYRSMINRKYFKSKPIRSERSAIVDYMRKYTNAESLSDIKE